MEWATPTPQSAASDLEEVTFDTIALGLQTKTSPSDADTASSTTTVTNVENITTSTTTTAIDSSSSNITTPEPLASDNAEAKSVDEEPVSTLEDLAAEDIKQESDQPTETTTIVTRRRSTRVTQTATTAPTTPATRTKSVKTSITTTVKRSLRSADKKNESVPVRRASTRLSAITALANLTAATPAAQNSKRSHEVMAAGSKSADAKLGGSYGKKIKTEESSTGNSKDVGLSATGSEVPPAALLVDGVLRKERRKKVWLTQGLYVGQDQDFDASLRPSQKEKLEKQKAKGKGKGKKKRSHALPLPMFVGLQIMETKRDFKMPFNVYAPNPWKCPSIPDWRRLNHNVFIGNASQVWKKEKSSNVKCVCDGDSCNDHCLNRCTWMECDDSNCNVGRHCKNRAFADLKERVKRSSKFDEGVEVVQTEDRGYGLRATRSFEPRQIIVEYTGEIITADESERRMCEDYKDNKNYYFMLFDQNMILDATRGSVARFVNHSCDPNCRMEKWLVEGKPRMALFAGDEGIEPGDELTYDYNFNWFTGVEQQPCKCGSKNCRGTLGKRTDAPPRKPKVKGQKGRPPKTASTTVKSKVSITKVKTKPIPLKPLSGRSRKEEPRKQRSVVVPKPKRKAPVRRAAESPPPVEPLRLSSSLSPAPSVSSDSNDDNSDVDFEAPKSTAVAKLVSSVQTRRRSGGKPRITRTYKVNKTIAPSTIAKSVTSKGALAAARNKAVDEALAIAIETAKGPKPKASKESTPRPRRGKDAVEEGEPEVFPAVPSSAERLSAAQLLNESAACGTAGASVIPMPTEIEAAA